MVLILAVTPVGALMVEGYDSFNAADVIQVTWLYPTVLMAILTPGTAGASQFRVSFQPGGVGGRFGISFRQPPNRAANGDKIISRKQAVRGPAFSVGGRRRS